MSLHVEMDIPADHDVIVGALQGLVAANVALMRAEPDRYPNLRAAGLLFRPEAPGKEDWKTADRLLDDGEGDCEDHTAYDVAWRIVFAGEPVTADVVPIGGTGNFHAVLRRADGGVEDPSMEIIKQETRTMKAKPKVCIKRGVNGCVGEISIPLAGGHVLNAQGVGWDPMQALQQAVDLVTEASNHPEVYAMLPPQASLALLAIHGISKMSDGGLQRLIKDPRATDAEIKLAGQVLKARKESMSADKGGDAARAQAKLNQFANWATWSDGVQGVIGAVTVYDKRGVATFGTHAGGDRTVDPVRQAPSYVVPTGQAANQGALNVRVPGSSVVTATAPPAGTATQPGATPLAPPGAVLVPPGAIPPGYPGGPPAPPGYPQPGAVPGGSISLYNDVGTQMPGFVWVDPMDGVTPPHWERPRAGVPSPTPQVPVIYPGIPGYGIQPTQPYGYPQGYPPGVPYSYPSPYAQPPSPYGYGYPSPYDPMAMYQQMYGGFYGAPPGGVVPWDPSQIMPEPLSADEAAAITLWGSGSFAEGAFPGYQQGY